MQYVMVMLMLMWPQTHKLKRLAFSICWQLPVVSVECIWFVDYLWVITIYHLISSRWRIFYIVRVAFALFSTIHLKVAILILYDIRLCVYSTVFVVIFVVFSMCVQFHVCLVHIIVWLVDWSQWMCDLCNCHEWAEASHKLKTWKENVREQSRLIKYTGANTRPTYYTRCVIQRIEIHSEHRLVVLFQFHIFPIFNFVFFPHKRTLFLFCFVLFCFVLKHFFLIVSRHIWIVFIFICCN